MYLGRTSMLKILKKTDGIALFVAILVMAVVMLFIGGGLFLSRIDAKISNNYKLGTQSLEIARRDGYSLRIPVPLQFPYNPQKLFWDILQDWPQF